MLTLLLLRHAKAEQQNRGDDFQRGLTDKGRADAQRLGRHLASIRVWPDLALVSSAVRTRETCAFLVEAGDRPTATRFDDGLYNATEGQLLDRLKLVDPSAATLMIVGHNPGIMDVAVRLARDGDVGDLGRLRARFPPCALAVIAFDRTDWREARSSGGRLDLLLAPEDFAATG